MTVLSELVGFLMKIPRPADGPLFVHLCGNIGAGKSTVLNYLRDKYNLTIEKEDLSAWKDALAAGVSVMGPMIEFLVIAHFVSIYRKHAATKGLIIVERSILDPFEFFMPALVKGGLLGDDDQLALANMFRKWWAPAADIGKHIYVYLRSSPEQCLERIRKRNQSGDEYIRVDYLRDLHEAHENALVNWSLVIDTTTEQT